MKVLGIETSCDETAVCIIETRGNLATIPIGEPNSQTQLSLPHFEFTVLGNALYSQVAIHAPYGGVFPNLAKREHARNLVPLLQQALSQSSLSNPSQQSHSVGEGLTFTSNLVEILQREPELLQQLEVFLANYKKPNVDCIAVTYGPGLEPALWVGVNFARALSTIWNIPLVAVNHMEGHIMMSAMRDGALAEFEFPLLSLLISGGHTELVLSREWMQYELIGQTRDDAVGEAFDKVARLIGLPYPGGPEISRLAAESRKRGLTPFSFTPPMLHSKDFDFSFSGIKTEVRKLVESLAPLDETTKMEIACAFEDAVSEVLVKKTLRAVEEYGAQTVVVGGGVSANTYIRSQLAEALMKVGTTQLLIPPPELATDNAVMIAIAGYFHAIKHDYVDPATLRAQGNLKLV
jgi:N6-L-threonylcarbamoyladenine synthase